MLPLIRELSPLLINEFLEVCFLLVFAESFLCEFRLELLDNYLHVGVFFLQKLLLLNHLLIPGLQLTKLSLNLHESAKLLPFIHDLGYNRIFFIFHVFELG